VNHLFQFLAASLVQSTLLKLFEERFKDLLAHLAQSE